MKATWKIFMVESDNVVRFLDTEIKDGIVGTLVDKTGNRFDTKEQALEAVKELDGEWGELRNNFVILETY